MINNRERLEGLVGFNPSQFALDGALVDVSVNPDQTYSPAFLPKIKAAAVTLLKVLLSTADTSNTEGFSQNYDRTAVLKRIGDLETEIDPTRGKSVIRVVNKW